MKRPSAPSTIALIVGVILLAFAISAGIFGFGGPAAKEGYWIAFWAALLAGAILSVPVFLVVTHLVDTWHTQGESDARRREVALACRALADDLRLFLSQSNNFSLRKPEKTIPAFVRRMERLLEDKPLSDWAEHAGTDDQRFLELVKTFRECYAYFLAACDEVKIDLPDAFVEWEREYRIVEVLPWQSLMFWVTANRVGDPSHYFKRSGQARLNALRLEESQGLALDVSLNMLGKHPRAAHVLTYFLKKRFNLFAAVQALVKELDVKADPDHADVPPSDQATGIVYGVVAMAGGGAVGTVSGTVTPGTPPD